jgi:DNA-binding beta-propeller fold protein YncE
VDIIDPATNSVTATVQTGNGSERMCYSLVDGNVFVDARSYSSIRVVDGTRDSIVASRTFPGYPNDLAYEPVYDRVYTGYFGRPYSTVVMIDASTYNTVGSVQMLGTPKCILASPVDSTVYVTSSDGASIYVIRAAAGAVAEPRVSRQTGERPASTLVRGVLFLPERAGTSSSASLLDINGRKVMDLLPGPNDVRALAPGVYFVRGSKAEDGRPSAVRKVVVQR